MHELLSALRCEPTSHGLQVPDWLAGTAPGAQLVHAALPSRANIPTAHGEQRSRAAFGAEPEWHRVQREAPGEEYSLAAQARHSDAPAAGANRPPGHSVHATTLFAGEYVPGAQGEHAVGRSPL